MNERGLSTAAAQRLDAERALTLRELLGVSDLDARVELQWYGRKQSVGHMLRLFSTHTLDHFQHLHRLLFDRGRKLTEANLLLMKATSLHAEFTTLVQCLSDAEFLRTGPAEGDWSAAQIAEHVLTTERGYRDGALAALGRPVTVARSSVAIRFPSASQQFALDVARAVFDAFGAQLAGVYLALDAGATFKVEVDGVDLRVDAHVPLAQDIVAKVRAHLEAT